MKKGLYVFLFVVASLLLSFLIHAVLEISILWWVQNNIAESSTNLFWNNWDFLHQWGGRILWLLGLIGGLYGGLRYWDILYVEKRYGQPRW